METVLLSQFITGYPELSPLVCGYRPEFVRIRIGTLSRNDAYRIVRRSGIFHSVSEPGLVGEFRETAFSALDVDTVHVALDGMVSTSTCQEILLRDWDVCPQRGREYLEHENPPYLIVLRRIVWRRDLPHRGKTGYPIHDALEVDVYLRPHIGWLPFIDSTDILTNVRLSGSLVEYIRRNCIKTGKDSRYPEIEPAASELLHRITWLLQAFRFWVHDAGLKNAGMALRGNSRMAGVYATGKLADTEIVFREYPEGGDRVGLTGNGASISWLFFLHDANWHDIDGFLPDVEQLTCVFMENWKLLPEEAKTKILTPMIPPVARIG